MQDLQEIVENDTSGQIAAFYHETIQGVGGAVELADGYLPAAYEIARKNGGVCVADEVQGGFGRLGMFLRLRCCLLMPVHHAKSLTTCYCTFFRVSLLEL